MKKLILLCTVFICLFTINSFSQNKGYACFENDTKKELKISVCFNNSGKAVFVKYKGQEETIPIYYSKITKSNNPGGNPSVWWAETYIEKYRGKVTGTYIFTNAGTYDLDVTYKRKKDNKEFYFTIIGGAPNSEDARYRSSPCF